MSNQTRAQRIGDVMLDMQNISLSFGGVKALTDISFNVREHEIPRHHRPQRRGQEFDAQRHQRRLHAAERRHHAARRALLADEPARAAEMGIARTFQNLALFKGMSVLDNIMTGRNLRMKSGLLAQALRLGPIPSARRSPTASTSRTSSTSWKSRPIAKVPVGRLPYGLQKRVDLGRARWPWSRACCCWTNPWRA